MCSTGLSFSDERMISGYILFIFLKTSKPRAEKTHHQSKEGHRVSAHNLKTGEMSNLFSFLLIKKEEEEEEEACLF